MNKLMRFLPFIVFGVLGAFLAYGIGKDPTKLPSAVVGSPLPEFRLLDVHDDREFITESDLTGRYALLNFWGTWCPACHIEHPFLMELAAQGVVIYGVDYKDQLEPAREWLVRYGDPYQRVLFDVDGKLGFDMGVTGAPETYLISPDGVVLARYQGPVGQQVFDTVFKPLMITN